MTKIMTMVTRKQSHKHQDSSFDGNRKTRHTIASKNAFNPPSKLKQSNLQSSFLPKFPSCKGLVHNLSEF